MLTCTRCGETNRAGRKFCSACGEPLGNGCSACGAPLEAGDRFCGECGSAVAPATAAPVAERRLVTVLFADLVGFTPLPPGAMRRTRASCSRATSRPCRRLIELYGGTVEKFIGDAVMAVWGAPAATEDDAERAVRAGLDLVAAISALGQELGAEDLRARAGVLTGEAAVTIGAKAEGMVAGDLVNTASRVQSAAEPGEVFVGEATRRASEQTIVYEEAGSYPLKGKDGLTPLWRARRVIAGRGGALKSQGLEAPFVGRDRELRQIKDLFHAAGRGARPPRLRKRHRRNRQVASRVGVLQVLRRHRPDVYWHRGRCLSYGEGVTYWALADMVRMRCRIAEDETGRGPREARERARRAPARCGRARVRRAARRALARPRRPAAARSARPVRGLAPASSSASPTPSRSCSCSRTCSGPTRACSTSSSTCSTGRAIRRSS